MRKAKYCGIPDSTDPVWPDDPNWCKDIPIPPPYKPKKYRKIIIRKAILRDVLIGIGIAIALITGGCEGMRPRYDAQGNGTRLGDKIERWLVHTVNQEHY